MIHSTDISLGKGNITRYLQVYDSITNPHGMRIRFITLLSSDACIQVLSLFNTENNYTGTSYQLKSSCMYKFESIRIFKNMLGNYIVSSSL